MANRIFLTAHDLIASGACRSSVKEWCSQHELYMGSVWEALSLAKEDEAAYIEAAAGIRGGGGYGGYGYGGGGYGYGGDGYGGGGGDGL